MGDSHIVYLGLGSNIGNRQEKLRQSIEKIRQEIGEVVRQSSVYETKPWGFDSPHLFLNACICVLTSLSPNQLLISTQKIEKQLGRLKKTTIHGHYTDRIIDIDILLYDNIEVSEKNLIIPHPLIKEREFVMKPLFEICPNIEELL